MFYFWYRAVVMPSSPRHRRDIIIVILRFHASVAHVRAPQILVELGVFPWSCDLFFQMFTEQE